VEGARPLLSDTVEYEGGRGASAVERHLSSMDLAGHVGARVDARGPTASPGPFEVLALLGRERTVEPLERLRAFLATRAGK